MKKAIGYIRISDKDQSNFSLEGQEKYIRKWAERKNVEIVAIFIDDGKSAKNFDRPDWKRLEVFLKDNSYDVDYLLFIKYDRFSRNLLQALMTIQKLEVKYNIMLEAVLEPISVPREHPDYFKQRTQYLFDAENEWHRIRSRTKEGIYTAKSEGRYISKAPFGYINMRDAEKKPIIEIDPERIHIIKGIFDAYLCGMPLTEIAREAKAKGLPLKGNSGIPRILSNCTYAGLVHVPAYMDEKEKYQKGLHTGIIDETTWMEIQYKLGTIKQPKQILNDEAPLRGVVKCECGKLLTGAKSRGKKKHYWYYKCNVHTKNNFAAKKMHTQFDELLSHLSLSPVQIDYAITKAKEEMEKQVRERTSSLAGKRADLKKHLELRESLEEKFITNQINHETYTKWHGNYTHLIYQLQSQIAHLEGDTTELWCLFESQLPKLVDLRALYHRATLTQKQLFIKQVFNSKLYYHNGCYRTPEILPILIPNALTMKEKSLLILDQEAIGIAEIPMCTPDGT